MCSLSIGMKSDDTSLITMEIIDAYLEMALGIMALRIPQIQDFLTAIPEASVKSSYLNEDLVISVSVILNGFKKEGPQDMKSLQNSFKQTNKVFMLAMWDILFNHRNYHSIRSEPEIQFFYHIRNGCAHNSKLNFKTIDKTAKWRDKEITESDRGKKVFPDILKDGDPILLMIDINNKFFHPIDLHKKI